MKKYQKVIKLKFTPGTCALCNSEDDELKSIEHNHTFYNSIENYRDMLMKCFSIKLINSEDQNIDVEICGNCVNSLRSAASFRQLVEMADKSIQKKAPYLKYGKFQRKDSTDCNKPGDSCQVEVKLEPSHNFFNDDLLDKSEQLISKIPEDSNNTEVKYYIFDTREHVNDKKYFITSAQMSCHQFEVKLESSEDFNPNLSKLSDQLLSEVPEDSNSVDMYDIFNSGEQVTDGESSTTSDQMRIVTGYAQEIERSKTKKTVIKPPLDISCKKCPICSQKFEVLHLLVTHYDNHFPTFVCDICGLSYSKKTSFSQHRRRHDKLSCTRCSRSFLTSDAKSAHIRAHHKKVKPMGCYDCDARFSSTFDRRRHMSSKHGRKCTMYPCLICEKSYYSSKDLSKHVNKTHDNIKNCFCTVCDKGYYGKQELRKHMEMHTDSNKHKCDKCEKSFPRLRSLTEHLKIHNNIKNYVCQICDKAFVQKCSLKTHVKIHTKISG